MLNKHPKVLYFNEPSKTKQEFKDECDIAKLMKKFKKIEGTDFLTKYNKAMGGSFGDFSNVTDYRTALENVELAGKAFMSLPAVVRSKFGNDAATFLDFVSDPKNRAEMVSMGFIHEPNKAQVKEPVSAPVQTAS